jgi:hypothetical protein
MKIQVLDLIKDLQAQIAVLEPMLGEEVDVHYSSDDINGYGGDITQVQYCSTDIHVVEEGVIHIATNFEKI